MQYRSKGVVRFISICVFLILIIMCNITFAHSGRTDSNGGHRDNKNKSGLGSYHYHCGGHPAHLHINGVCPYSNNSATNTNEENTLNSSTVLTQVPEDKKEENSNTMSSAINKNSTDKFSDSSSENSDLIGTMISLGILGGGGYLGYKKRKGG